MPGPDVVILRKLNSLMRMDSRRRGLMAEAAVCLAVARGVLLVFPFRHVARRLGRLTSPGAAAAAGGDQELAKAVGWAVRRTATYVPFKAVCLQQAIAARMMLRRRGVESALHFGVARGESPASPLRAHAWLDTAGAKITGYPVRAGFVEIACFL